MSTIWKPSVTVAAIIERNKRFLMVEEEQTKAFALTSLPAIWTRMNHLNKR